MLIKEMFTKDIERNIQSVIKIEEQDNDSSFVIGSKAMNEIEEYIVTEELSHRFDKFFTAYLNATTIPTDKIGVWISGFFGSGKSHFLKILSYILANKKFKDTDTVTSFKNNMMEYPEIYAKIKAVADSIETECITFNIDNQTAHVGSINPVVRVFAKMFYNHLGFYGNNPDIINFEKQISSEGKYEEFKAAILEISGKTWEEIRPQINIKIKILAQAMEKVFGMDENSFNDWKKSCMNEDLSIDTLVEDMKKYIATKPSNYRLVFCIDEAGQYIANSTEKLLNLQTIVEGLGVKLKGRIWVICTGQEGLDQIVKAQKDSFSKIQDRFNLRLPLSSSSVDEVIQKRLLTKTPEAKASLKQLYKNNDGSIHNLFSFDTNNDTIKRGLKEEEPFIANYPFVAYQAELLVKAIESLRRVQNIAANISDGARSLLKGFQLAATQYIDESEGALVPFYSFFESISSSLDSEIQRRFASTEENAKDENSTISTFDYNLLKTLYLIRYIDKDLPANVENLAVLMVRNINDNKRIIKQEINASLNHLMNQNLVGKFDNTYRFLTNEEQDIQRKINSTSVSPDKINSTIRDIIFGNICEDILPKRFRYKGLNGQEYDYDFTKKVDDITEGKTYDTGLTLQFFTTDYEDKTYLDRDLKYTDKSYNIAAIFMAKDDKWDYYNLITKKAQIDSYINEKMSAVESEIAEAYKKQRRLESAQLGDTATEYIRQCINNGKFYVGGTEYKEPGDLKNKLNALLSRLVEIIYPDLNLVGEPVPDNVDLKDLFAARGEFIADNNSLARDRLLQHIKTLNGNGNTLVNIKNVFQKAPYGWREIDVNWLLGELWRDGKIDFISNKAKCHYNAKDQDKFYTLIRSKDYVEIAIHESVDSKLIKVVRDFLVEYCPDLSLGDIPENEDSLLAFCNDYLYDVTNKESKLNQVKTLLINYSQYPDRYPNISVLTRAEELLYRLNRDSIDTHLLFNDIAKYRDELLDNMEDLEDIVEFFKPNSGQKKAFDEGVELVRKYNNDMLNLATDEANTALNKTFEEIKVVVKYQPADYQFSKIRNLRGYIDTFNKEYSIPLMNNKDSVREYIKQAENAIQQHPCYNKATGTKNAIDIDVDNLLKELNASKTISEASLIKGRLDNLSAQWQKNLDIYQKQQAVKNSKAKSPTTTIPETKKPSIPTVTIYKNYLIPNTEINNEKELEELLDKIRSNLKAKLSNGKVKLIIKS